MKMTVIMVNEEPVMIGRSPKYWNFEIALTDEQKRQIENQHKSLDGRFCKDFSVERVILEGVKP